MKNFILYQINLTDEQANEVNRAKGDYPQFFRDYLATTCAPNTEKVLAANYLYDWVADIKANDLDGVFETGNIGPEENITRYMPMHSVSVGDVIIDEDGDAYVVASFGFDKIEGFSGMKKAS